MLNCIYYHAAEKSLVIGIIYMKQKFFRLGLYLLCYLIFQVQIGYADIKSDALRIQRIENYFKDLGNIKAEFEQVGSNGKVQKGRLYISRPDKMRWEYNTPEKYLIIVNYDTIIHYRYGLDELTHIPLKSSFLRFFCKEDLKLTEGAEIIGIKEDESTLSASFIDKDREDSPEITMNFIRKPMSLESIFIKDMNGASIRIFFYNIKQQPKIDHKLFEFKRPV